jgi:glycosyltransferase involved in cell wall biosynthesis
VASTTSLLMLEMPAPESPARQERVPSTPPVILPVASDVKRPLFSVMIPAYNCLGYLAETLESVLAQDLGPEQMQIAVIDDCSTDGDVSALVRDIGKNRVDFFRQPVNVGSLRNFETCLNCATGEWVHLLHGDDRVAPGFYAEIISLFRQYPEAGAAFTNTADLFMRPTGAELRDRPPIVREAGILQNFLLMQAEVQKVETPSIVVKRSVYEQLGGFFAVHYGEDWIMWVRIAAHFPVAYSPKCLAQYRYLNTTSISYRFFREGQNIRDMTKVITIINQYLPNEHRRRLKKNALYNYAIYCLAQVDGLYLTDKRAALAQLTGALKMSQDVRLICWAVKICVNNMLGIRRLKQIGRTKNK